VEDEVIVARDLQRLLLELGYDTVGSTSRGEQAVVLAGQLRPDLVLMDIRLSGSMDGIAAARIIRAKFSLPIVFLTAFAAENVLARAKLTEPFGYVLKPFSERELRTVLEMALYKHQAEARLRESTQHARLFFAAFEQTTDVIIILDAAGRVLHANPACLALVGGSAREIMGRSVRETGLVPRSLRVYREIIAALVEESEWHGEYEASGRRREPRRLAVSVTSTSNVEPEPRFVVSARDVSDQRRLEYIADAENLVANFGYVFAGLRHELGNPINSIKSALTVVRQGLWTLPPDRVETYLDRVLQEVARVEYLLRSLQNFNATQPSVLEPVPIGAFLARFSSIIRPDVESRGVSLECVVDEPSATVSADPRALHQVLLNLLTNALDALAGRAEPRIQIAARRRGAHLLLIVSDNGAGIAPDRRPHVFKPFHTTKHKGTGLGLAITRKLVTLMHGTIELGPTGTGETVFTVTLDAADVPETARARRSVQPPALRGAS
jgi:PAS domain S-box-containing protein